MFIRQWIKRRSLFLLVIFYPSKILPNSGLVFRTVLKNNNVAEFRHQVYSKIFIEPQLSVIIIVRKRKCTCKLELTASYKRHVLI